MTPTGRWIVAVPLVLVVLAMGCTDSNPIGSSSSELSLTADLVGDAGRFDTASLIIRQVRLRPADPTTREALGNTEIGLLSFVATADLNAGGTVTLAIGAPVSDAVPLVAGTYELTLLRLGDFVLDDSTTPLPPGAECIDNINTLTTRTGTPTQPMDVTIADFDPPIMFELRGGSPGELRMSIDVPGFVELIEGQFVCSPTTPCSGGRPAPCLAVFNTPSASQLKSVVSFP